MTVCMEIPGDDPTKGEPENAAGRGGRKSMQGERQFASCGHFVYMR